MSIHKYGLKRLQPCDFIPSKTLVDVNDNRVELKSETGLIHLQFRRFAGCPICNLHLQSVKKHYEQLQDLGIREIVVFHSSKEQLKKYTREFPFTLIGDPNKALYRKFGVGEAAKSLTNPKAWLGIFKGIVRSLWDTITTGKPIPPINPSGGSLGLPADFLIAPDGRIVACKYGEHADDQWTVHELISLVNTYKNDVPCNSIQSL